MRKREEYCFSLFYVYVKNCYRRVTLGLGHAPGDSPLTLSFRSSYCYKHESYAQALVTIIKLISEKYYHLICLISVYVLLELPQY